MNLVTTIPIYRNRFQKPTLFFSSNHFSSGSLIFVPYPKTIKSKKRKPALIIQIDNLEKQKFFLRKNNVKISHLDNSLEQTLLKPSSINLILSISEKTNLTIEEILQKIFTKKMISALNQLSLSKNIYGSPICGKLTSTNIKSIQKFSAQLTPVFIKEKVIKKNKLPTATKNKQHGIQTIRSIIALPNNKKNSIHSEKHYLVDEIRNYFGEKSKKGVGSFSFYLGFFKKIPTTTIYQYWAEAKESRKSIKNQQKLFWWKIGQFLKEQKNTEPQI